MLTAEFIASHRNDDVSLLALQAARYPTVDMPFALTQIEGWQKARQKIPSWAATEGIVYPPRRAMEQCSSEATARYKRRLVARWTQQCPPGRALTMVDLTGGAGVDSAFLAPLFSKVTFIDRDAHLCAIAQSNFKCLGVGQIDVVCGAAEDLFPAMKPCFLAYVDPDRRSARGRHIVLSSCTPDVIALNTLLLQRAAVTMIKCSPMLDWHDAVRTLRGVRQVHIVAVDNECKELLLVLAAPSAADGRVQVCCTNDGDTITFDMSAEQGRQPPLAPPLTAQQRGFLYEPHAAVMKGGCFALVGERYGLAMVARDSHLFLSPEEIGTFCGRRFVIERVSTMNKSDVKALLGPLTQANIVVRNFPLSAAALRQRLALRDGGDSYLFATTDSAQRHWLLLCRRL